MCLSFSGCGKLLVLRWLPHDMAGFSYTLTQMKPFFQGVTNSYCYIGTHGTCFPLHTEDMDLGAVNYLHWGKPKVWYIVALCDAEKLENKIIIIQF